MQAREGRVPAGYNISSTLPGKLTAGISERFAEKVLKKYESKTVKLCQPKGESSVSRGRFNLALSGIFALALFVRILHLLSIRNAPFFSLALGDAQVYQDWANRIASGNWLGSTGWAALLFMLNVKGKNSI